MPAPAAAPRSYRGVALCTTVLCLLAVVAAVAAFVQGRVVLGVVWVLLTGLSSNMAWYYGRRARRAGRVPAGGAAPVSASVPTAGSTTPE